MPALETCDEKTVGAWLNLEEQRRQLLVRINFLRQCLMNFSESPVAWEILKRVEAHELVCVDLEFEVQAARENIRWRTLALTDTRTAADVALRLKERVSRLKTLEELNAPVVILARETRLICDCAAPIAELKESLKPRELELAYCRQLCENTAEEYRAAKRACKAELVTAEEEFAQITEAQHGWVSADRERLAWVLSQHSDRSAEMILAYRLVHPEDALRDLVPVEERTGWPPPSARPPSRKRRRASSNGDAGTGQAAPEQVEAADG